MLYCCDLFMHVSITEIQIKFEFVSKLNLNLYPTIALYSFFLTQVPNLELSIYTRYYIAAYCTSEILLLF